MEQMTGVIHHSASDLFARAEVHRSQSGLLSHLFMIGIVIHHYGY